MKQTMTNLKQLIRTERGIISAQIVILKDNLVNVMTAEIYKADVAIYEDTIVAVSGVSEYMNKNTKIIYATDK